MKTKLNCLLVLFLAISIHASAQKAAKKSRLHIFILMGQSNMVGRDTTGLSAQTTDARIKYLDRIGRWRIAIEPMHPGGSGMGPGIPFASEMIKKYPGDTIGLVPCAVGGTPLSRWVKGADLYENAIKQAKQAMLSGKLEGVIWHQGESDCEKAENAQTYEARLIQMFKDLRQDLGSPGLPIVVGQLGGFVKFPYADLVKATIAHIPAELPNIGFADSNDLTDKGDHLHFNTASQLKFGFRYAEAMKKL